MVIEAMPMEDRVTTTLIIHAPAPAREGDVNTRLRTRSTAEGNAAGIEVVRTHLMIVGGAAHHHDATIGNTRKAPVALAMMSTIGTKTLGVCEASEKKQITTNSLLRSTAISAIIRRRRHPRRNLTPLLRTFLFSLHISRKTFNRNFLPISLPDPWAPVRFLDNSLRRLQARLLDIFSRQ